MTEPFTSDGSLVPDGSPVMNDGLQPADLGEAEKIRPSFHTYDIVLPNSPLQRVQPALAAKLPYGAIAAIYAGGTFYGTGFFVGPNVVLTAGHVIKAAGAVPVAAFSVHPFGSTNALSVLAGKYANPAQAAAGYPFDLALLRVSGNVPAGYIRLKVAAANEIPRGTILEISGFPGEEGGTGQYRHVGRLVDESYFWLDYVVNTRQGHSGSPVLLADGRGVVAIALHTMGPNANPNYYANRGIRMTAELKGWVDSYATTA